MNFEKLDARRAMLARRKEGRKTPPPVMNYDSITPSQMAKSILCRERGSHEWQGLHPPFFAYEMRTCRQCKKIWRSHSFRKPRLDRRGRIVL